MGSVKVDKKRWESIKRNLLKLDGLEVDVGFFKKDKYGPENDNLPVATVAYINDQGNNDVPARPFMTVDFDIHIREHFKSDAKAFFKAFLSSRRYSYLPHAKNIGEMYRDALRSIIFDYPGSNSDWWAAYKGFNDPLFHTGTMVESVDYRIKRGG